MLGLQKDEESTMGTIPACWGRQPLATSREAGGDSSALGMSSQQQLLREELCWYKMASCGSSTPMSVFYSTARMQLQPILDLARIAGRQLGRQLLRSSNLAPWLSRQGKATHMHALLC